MRASLLLLLTACSGPQSLPPLVAPPVDVELLVAAPHVASGAPVEVEVRVWQTDGWTLDVSAPAGEGLTVQPGPVDGPSQVGRRTRTVARFSLSGEDGSYVIGMAPVVAHGPGDQERTIEPAPLFVDIGVDGPKMGELAEVETPPPPPPPDPTPWIVGLASGALLAGLAGAVWWHRRRPVPPPPPVPADVAARAAWTAARASQVDDHALALALSRILREYVEAVTAYPATARTTNEILGWMEQEGLLAASLRIQLARVLDATDRLKFAREGGGTGFFDALEADFLAVVAALMPTPVPTPAPEKPAEASDV